LINYFFLSLFFFFLFSYSFQSSPYEKGLEAICKAGTVGIQNYILLKKGV